MENKQLVVTDSNEQFPLFDYGTLDLDTRSFVQTKTAEIRILVKQTAQGIIEIGQRLIEVKEKLGHGEFESWLRSEFNWGKSSAYKFINAFERFGNRPEYGRLDFSISTICLLASPSTPEPARVEALERAEYGEKITHIAGKLAVTLYCGRGYAVLSG